MTSNNNKKIKYILKFFTLHVQTFAHAPTFSKFKYLPSSY